jgi:hypothetical protein
MKTRSNTASLPVLALVLALATAMAGPAAAQPVAAPSGNWAAIFNGPDGMPRKATVVLSDTAGSWQNTRTSAMDPCVVIKTPVTVTDVTAEGFVFNYDAAKALSGCPRWAAPMRRVDEKTYEGTMPNGGKLTLTRQ